jgi:hypothetical protein
MSYALWSIMTRSRTALSRATSAPGIERGPEWVDEQLRELKAEVQRLEQARLALVSSGLARAAHGRGAADLELEELDMAERSISRSAVLAGTAELASYLQEHLGQRLTAYLAGLKDVKMVGQWAKGRVEPPAITRERLRAAFYATALFLVRYGDAAAQGWFFGANSSLDDRAPAAVLRDAETPDELALIVPLARAFVRAAH